VQRLEPNAGEDIEKGAITDALKKAATLFGVGLETYADEHEAAPDALTEAQERIVAEARDMATESQPYPAVVNHLRQLQTDATPDQWTAIKRALAAIKARHYQTTEV